MKMINDTWGAKDNNLEVPSPLIAYCWSEKRKLPRNSHAIMTMTNLAAWTKSFQSNDGSSSSMCLELALEGERLCKSGDCRAGVAFFQVSSTCWRSSPSCWYPFAGFLGGDSSWNRWLEDVVGNLQSAWQRLLLSWRLLEGHAVPQARFDACEIDERQIGWRWGSEIDWKLTEIHNQIIDFL